MGKAQEAIEAARSAPGYGTCVKALERMRVEQVHAPLDVIAFSKHVLPSISSTGSSRWDVYEQIAVAALETGEIESAETCLSALRHQFPESKRVRLLSGMVHEAAEDYEVALELYKAMIDETPNSPDVIKRLVGVHKARGDMGAAVSVLTKYLETYQTDPDAWAELGSLSAEMGTLKRASFCYEELILLEPHNYVHHTLYAETLFTMGAIGMAAKYFAMAVDLSASAAPRPLMGLLVAAARILAKNASAETQGASSSSSSSAVSLSGADKKANALSVDDAQAYFDLARAELTALYSAKNPTLLDSFNATVQSLLKQQE